MDARENGAGKHFAVGALHVQDLGQERVASVQLLCVVVLQLRDELPQPPGIDAGGLQNHRAGDHLFDGIEQHERVGCVGQANDRGFVLARGEGVTADLPRGDRQGVGIARRW